VPANSPLAASIGDQLVRYSSQAVADAAAVSAPGASDKLEALRRDATAAKNNGQFDAARAKLNEVIAKSAGHDSETLYRAWFSLALLAEYHDHDLAKAEEAYQKAEDIRDRLKIRDASLPNTFGYFWYKRARDTHDADARKQYAENARKQLKTALAIDPGYAKSINTLDGLQRLLAATAPTPAAPTGS